MNTKLKITLSIALMYAVMVGSALATTTFLADKTPLTLYSVNLGQLFNVLAGINF